MMLLFIYMVNECFIFYLFNVTHLNMFTSFHLIIIYLNAKTIYILITVNYIIV
jgi:hypothetical protein